MGFSQICFINIDSFANKSCPEDQSSLELRKLGTSTPGFFSFTQILNDTPRYFLLVNLHARNYNFEPCQRESFTRQLASDIFIKTEEKKSELRVFNDFLEIPYMNCSFVIFLKENSL